MSSPNVQTEIWLALEARLKTLAAVPNMPPLVMPEEVTPQPTSGGTLRPFLLISDIRDAPERLTIGPEIHARSGTLQISVAWPIAAPISHAALVQLAGTVAAHFPADLRMRYGKTCLSVAEEPDTPAPFTEGPYRYAPVRVPWRKS